MRNVNLRQRVGIEADLHVVGHSRFAERQLLGTLYDQIDLPALRATALDGLVYSVQWMASQQLKNTNELTGSGMWTELCFQLGT